jgi:LmbE family N-acetylglucosaminyl deacetylase
MARTDIPSWLAPDSISRLRPIAAPTGKRIAVIAPHPDDDLLGCGGTLAQVREQDSDPSVHVLYLTDGEKGSPSPARSATEIASMRREEARQGLAVLGLDAGEYASFPDGGLVAESGAIERVVRFLKTYPPEIVMTPAPLDPHPDHRAASAILAQALLADALEPSVWIYEVQPCFPMNALIRIDDTAAIKARALGEHVSQGAGRLVHAANGLASCRAMYAPRLWKYAEAFRVGSAANFIALCRSLGLC